MDFILKLVFINQQHDLKFVFLFRKICKKYKLFSNEWLDAILNPSFFVNVHLNDFHNLRKLMCSGKLR